MKYLTQEMLDRIGVKTPRRTAPDPITSDAVRRFVHATLETHPLHLSEQAGRASRFGGWVVPPLYPVHTMRRPLDSPDPLDRANDDPDFDGSLASRGELPKLNLPLRRRLNAGSEIEFIRMAEVGDRVSEVSCYSSLVEKESSSGTIVLEQVETTYSNDAGETLLNVYKTSINR